MVIYDFNIECMTRIPPETYAILLVDSDAVLSLALSTQGLQSVSGRNPKVTKLSGGIKQPQLAKGYPLNRLRQFPRRSPSLVQPLGIFTLE